MWHRTLLAIAAIALLAPVSAAQDRGWTLDEAMAQLAEHPGDRYCQYVALQLAHRSGNFEAHASQIEQLTRNELRQRRNGRGRGRDVDLFNLFSGALAVQESLQLDTMRNPQGQPGGIPGPEAQAVVNVNTLRGPTIRSHPWLEMLGGRKPALSPLSKMVPEDFYLLEFTSTVKMLSVFENGDMWSRFLFQQGAHDATTADISGHIHQQLAIETNRLLRPLYDKVVEHIAITGSDLYVREGSDVTLLFRLKQPKLFRTRMDSFLETAAAKPGATRSSGEILGVPFQHVTTPDRSTHVFSAYPEPGLHLRSNSVVALRRILEAIRGTDGEGRAVARLGDTDEFAYIRTLMPWGSSHEDGLLYLSDPLIRRLVGPQVKLTEMHRMRCYNHLRMIGHAAMMFRTEHGAVPTSLETLAKTQCAPGVFGEGALACSDGGAYSLAEDGMSGACSHHGHPDALIPCCEIPLSSVPAAEAAEYEAFLEEYSRYWRTFFDPIAVRLQVESDLYRVETIVLPLLDNSIYTGMATALGGSTEPLDALPVPSSNIFSVGLKFDKQPLLGEFGQMAHEFSRWIAQDMLTGDEVEELFARGLGNQISLNICDSDPMFDFSLPQAIGQAMGSFNGGRGIDDEWVWISFLLASLNSPVYLAVPVQDTAVVDDFLERLDPLLALWARQPSSGGWFDVENDFYRLPDIQGHQVRGATIGFGPIKWRFFWSRIGDGLYLASKRGTLEEILGATPSENSPRGHAMVRVRPKHWAAVLHEFELGWAEGNREACLGNLGPLSHVARAFDLEDKATTDLPGLAADLYGSRFYCPDRGEYRRTSDGRAVHCSVHGTVAAPRQPHRPDAKSDLGALLRQFKGLTSTLTFTEEGLRAVVEIKRQ